MSRRSSLPPAVAYLAVAAALLLSTCAREAAGDAKKGGKKGDSVPVTIARVTTRNVPIELQVMGNVEAFSTVVIKARVTGVIEKVHFIEGDFVRKGDRLFTIDPAQFQTALSQAEANLNRDRALLEQARANLSRDQAQLKFLTAQAARFANLQKEGVISRDQAEQQQASADVVAQGVAAGRAAISSAEAAVQAGEASVKTARIMLGYTNVVSPVEGRTGTLVAKEGNLAAANVTELISISQVQPIYVSFAVPESQLPLIKEAMARGRLPVQAAPPDFPDKPESGALTFIDSSIDVNTGTIRLKGTFANPIRHLWPGQFVRVTVGLGTRSDAMLVPNQAVQNGQDGSFVYRVKPDQSVEMAKIVTAGRVNEDMVVASGLAPEDTIVTEGQLRLAPGMKIRLRDDSQKKGKGKKKSVEQSKSE